VDLLGKSDRATIQRCLTDPIDVEYQVEKKPKSARAVLRSAAKRKGHEKVVVKHWVTKD
jgi:hypothetical protein